MNAASLESPRLSRVLKALDSGQELSTLEIVRQANVCAVNSCIAELRSHGLPIECRSEQRGGQRVWLYRLP